MHNFANRRVFENYASVMEALDHEPDIRPNLSRAGLAMTLTVIYCLVYKGVANAAAIHRYLDARGCVFDRDAVDFLLDAYEGEDPRHHLWSRDLGGQYVPLLGAFRSDDHDDLPGDYYGEVEGV